MGSMEASAAPENGSAAAVARRATRWASAEQKRYGEEGGGTTSPGGGHARDVPVARPEAPLPPPTTSTTSTTPSSIEDSRSGLSLSNLISAGCISSSAGRRQDPQAFSAMLLITGMVPVAGDLGMCRSFLPQHKYLGFLGLFFLCLRICCYSFQMVKVFQISRALYQTATKELNDDFMNRKDQGMSHIARSLPSEEVGNNSQSQDAIWLPRIFLRLT